jgi:hypothetical protein
VAARSRDDAAMPALADLTVSQHTTARSLAFVKWLSCLQVTRGARTAASALYAERWPRTSKDLVPHDLVMKCVGAYRTTDFDPAGRKAAIAAGSTTDATWAAPLVHDELAKAFYDVAVRASLLGRIPGLRHIPIRAKVPTLTSDATYVWVGESSLKPASRFSFSDGLTLESTKAQAIVVVTRELAELAVPGLEGVLRDYLLDGLTAFTDHAFLDPAAAGVPGVQPPSITAGLTPIVATGDLATDLGALIAALSSSRPSAETVVLIASPGSITAKDVPIGATVVTSAAAAGLIVAADPSGLFVADTGLEFDVSFEALLELDTAPTGTAGSTLTPLFQSNLAAYRIERYVNWAPVPGSVQYLTLS